MAGAIQERAGAAWAGVQCDACDGPAGARAFAWMGDGAGCTRRTARAGTGREVPCACPVLRTALRTRPRQCMRMTLRVWSPFVAHCRLSDEETVGMYRCRDGVGRGHGMHVTVCRSAGAAPCIGHGGGRPNAACARVDSDSVVRQHCWCGQQWVGSWGISPGRQLDTEGLHCYSAGGAGEVVSAWKGTCEGYWLSVAASSRCGAGRGRIQVAFWRVVVHQ